MIFAANEQYLFTATPGNVLTRWDIADRHRIACRQPRYHGESWCPGAGAAAVVEAYFLSHQ